MYSNISEFLNSSVTKLNINKTIISAYNRLGIKNFRDLLFYLPVRLEFFKFCHNFHSIQAGDLIVFYAEVIFKENQSGFKNKPDTKILVKNLVSHDTITLIFFKLKYKYDFTPGKKFLIHGQLDIFRNKYTCEYKLIHPNIFPINDDINIDLVSKKNKINPIYNLTYGITSNLINKHIKLLFQILREMEFDEWLNLEFNKEARLPPFLLALRILHGIGEEKYYPGDIKNLVTLNESNVITITKSLERIKFDEALYTQIILYKYRLERKLTAKGISLSESRKITNFKEEALDKLPFELTKSQKQVLSEIEHDQDSKQEMVRLLQGDVGSGKTIIAFLSMLRAVDFGFQAVLIAPTDILAKQHYLNFLKYNSEKINITCLTGSTGKKERQYIYKAIETGSVKIIIGTHAIFEDMVNLKNLQLIVIDEQHKFGVLQRYKMKEKTENYLPDILLMSATPIPRSLAMALYGDIDISIITEKPHGRKDIETKKMHISKINDLYSSLQKAVDMNMQIYWVCPSIGEEEKDNNMDNINNNESPQLASIYGRYSELVKHLGEDKVIFVHGKLKASEKEAALAEFANGNKQILLATTVIEVGINVPNATIMIIEQAERFGLAQLHQIRGRVGRSEKASHCILIYYNLHEISKARLEIMEKSNDGFVIAKKDLALRGGGEVVGKKQSGFNNSTFGDINYDIIERAKDYLEKYIKIDNNFSQFNMLLEIFNIYAKEDNDLMH